VILNRLRILVLAPESNPEAVSIPFVTYSNAAALAELHDVTLLVRSTVEEPVRRAKAAFKSVEVVRMPLLERFYAWALRRIFKYNYDTQALTAFGYPYAIAFEWSAWRQFRKRIFAGEFDVVLRLMPMAPTLPSPFAFFLRKGPVPFVLGPLNGGLRSAPGFSQPDKRSEWVWTVRNLYRYLPFARSTYRYAAAIIIASYHMRAEFVAHRDKMFFVPENGIARSLCLPDSRIPEPGAKLKLIFIGGLVPRKACYIGLRAAAPLLRKDLAHFTIVGDGPERKRLEELANSLQIEKAVSFCGWLSHAEVLKSLRSSDVVVLPAIREGGGGVVFEALAGGTVPVVLDHGGPGDIVNPEVGFKVPPSNENNVVSEMENILAELASNRDLLERLRRRGMSYAQKCLTWEAKARSVTSVLRWVVGEGPKPDLTPATMLQAGSEANLEISARS
jgi:glycosyltransferase involved in cell wall biosynthesis